MSESIWNDQRITAYVLDELPADERDAFDEELRTNEELAAAVAQARQVTSQLGELYVDELAPPLDSDRRETILAAKSGAEPTPVALNDVASGKSPRVALLIMATAATLLVLLGLAPWMAEQRSEVAMQSLEDSLARESAAATEAATGVMQDGDLSDHPHDEFEMDEAAPSLALAGEIRAVDGTIRESVALLSEQSDMPVAGEKSSNKESRGSVLERSRQADSQQQDSQQVNAGGRSTNLSTSSRTTQPAGSSPELSDRPEPAGDKIASNQMKESHPFADDQPSDRLAATDESLPGNKNASVANSSGQSSGRENISSGGAVVMNQPRFEPAVAEEESIGMDAIELRIASDGSEMAEFEEQALKQELPKVVGDNRRNLSSPEGVSRPMQRAGQSGSDLSGRKQDTATAPVGVPTLSKQPMIARDGTVVDSNEVSRMSSSMKRSTEKGQASESDGHVSLEFAASTPVPKPEIPSAPTSGLANGRGDRGALAGGGQMKAKAKFADGIRFGGVVVETANGKARYVVPTRQVQPGFLPPQEQGLGIDYDEANPEGTGPGKPGDQFEPITDNPFKRVSEHPLSTFSVDVDTASYSKTRDFLMRANQLPRPDAVRIEELVNYFDYDYEGPGDDADHPFVARAAVTGCPWNQDHRLARIAIKGKEMNAKDRPKCNLVFLIDTSGSMNAQNKLPLVQQGMKMLADRLNKKDRVAIVVYAGSAGLVLDSTKVGKNGKEIKNALTRLSAGGSTNGGAGIALAYQTARDNFIADGVNRVILCTDGDFNVGLTGTDALVRMVEKEAKGGVFLSVLGFGMGNHNDAMLEKVSGRGNGNYAFIDTHSEARKVLVEQTNATLVTIAKDVKLQVEFNPSQVSSYRLIGYENRILAKEDFNDDKKDAGEIGAGHEVTALYEIVPAGKEADAAGPKVDPLKYQTKLKPTDAADNDELVTVKLRYKQPDEDVSTLIEFPVVDSGGSFDDADEDTRFAAAVAGFGMQLRRSDYKGTWTLSDVLSAAEGASGDDEFELRAEFLTMVRKASELMGEE